MNNKEIDTTSYIGDSSGISRSEESISSKEEKLVADLFGSGCFLISVTKYDKTDLYDKGVISLIPSNITLRTRGDKTLVFQVVFKGKNYLEIQQTEESYNHILLVHERKIIFSHRITGDNAEKIITKYIAPIIEAYLKDKETKKEPIDEPHLDREIEVVKYIISQTHNA